MLCSKQREIRDAGCFYKDMEGIPCHTAPEHTAVWGCSCTQPTLNFCTTCLTLHVQSPGQHTISPLGHMGSHLCGMRKGQSSNPIICQYPVCICQRCVQRFPDAGEPSPPEIFGRPVVRNPLMNEEAKQAAEGSVAQVEAILRIYQPSVSLQEAFQQRKNEIHQSIMRTMDSMNGLESIFYGALAQEAELRVCQNQLAYAQDEIRRLQALPQPLAVPSNEALVEALKTQLEHISTRLQDQDALQSQMHNLSTQVSQLKCEIQPSVKDLVAEKLRESQRSLQYVARTTVLKVSDVMPLVSLPNGDFLDHEGAESLMELASLGINDDVQSVCMRQVARVCSTLVKASGPCQYLASFANQINVRLKRNSEVALRFINQLEDLYFRYKETPTAKASLQRLLKLADSEAFDDIVTALLRFANYLDAAKLTYFGDYLMDFIAQDTATRDDWRMALLSLPVEWSQQYKEEMSGVLQTVVERKFDCASLKLVQLLQLYQSADPTFLSFTTRTTHLLTNSQVVPNVEALLQAQQLSCLPLKQNKCVTALF